MIKWKFLAPTPKWLVEQGFVSDPEEDTAAYIIYRYRPSPNSLIRAVVAFPKGGYSYLRCKFFVMTRSKMLKNLPFTKKKVKEYQLLIKNSVEDELEI
jgi:hypothetical protein